MEEREIKFNIWYKQENQMIDWFNLSQSAWNTFRGDKPLSLIYDALEGAITSNVESIFAVYVGETVKNVMIPIVNGDKKVFKNVQDKIKRDYPHLK